MGDQESGPAITEEGDDETAKSPAALNKATVRVLQVLAAFVGRQKPCGISELGRALGMTKSMVQRALVTLEGQGYLRRDPASALYELGPGLLELSFPSDGEPSVHDLAAPFLPELVGCAGETAMILVQASDRAVVVGGLQSPRSIGRRVAMGSIFPLHASSAGRCILAYLPEAVIGAYLTRPLERFTERTIVDPHHLRAELSRIRREGRCIGIGELSADTCAIGFPVLDADGRPHGAVVLAGPSDRFNLARIEKVLPGLEAIMAEMHRNSRLYRTIAR